MRPTVFICNGNEKVKYLIYDKAGIILRTIECSPAMASIQAKKGEFIMEGEANDAVCKIVDGKIVSKTPEEIEATDPTVNPAPVPFEKQIAYITNKQWQDVLDRLAALEAEPL